MTTEARETEPSRSLGLGALGVGSLLGLIRRIEVPIAHRKLQYYSAGAVLILLVVQMVSGVLLHLHYVPTPETAYESTVQVLNGVPFGWLVLSMHAWNVHLLIGVMIFHLVIVFVQGNHRAPYHIRWLLSVGLLCTFLALAITGYLLPWTVSAFHSTSIRTALAGELPIVGEELEGIVRGGEQVGGATLTRFFGFHASLLPAIATLIAILWIAVWMRVRSRISAGELPPPSKRPTTTIPLFPHFTLHLVLLATVVVWCVLLIATIWPWEPGPKSDLLAPPPPGLKPDWYFMSLYELMAILENDWHLSLLGMSGAQIGLLLTVTGFGVIVLLPWIAGGADRGVRRNLASVLGGLVLFVWCGLMILGYRR